MYNTRKSVKSLCMLTQHEQGARARVSFDARVREASVQVRELPASDCASFCVNDDDANPVCELADKIARMRAPPHASLEAKLKIVEGDWSF